MKPIELSNRWKNILVGQDHAIEKVMPYLNRFNANLNLPRRTVSNIFLVGPTGTGKTKTPETLAQVLHGSERNLLSINCETYQADHEIAKLIGSPPGYLGHRETVAMLAQSRIDSVASDKCKLSIIVFDEIEKASAALWRVILGIMDKAELKLGDNTTANFENCIIFLTSNLGTAQMSKMMNNNFGLNPPGKLTDEQLHSDVFSGKLEKIGMKSVEKGFSPEFFNRLDETIVYQPLTLESFQKIVHLELTKLSAHIKTRLQDDGFFLDFDDEVVELLAKKGHNPTYGGRFVKRVIEKDLYNRLCADYLCDNIPPTSTVYVYVTDEDELDWEIHELSFDEDTEQAFA